MNARLSCAALVAAVLCLSGPSNATEPTAEAYRAGVAACMKAGDLACAEKNWQQVLRLQPTDSRAMANLGILMNRRDDHRAAIAMFERALDLGEGTWDLFSYYADSLEKVGRIDDAIAWSYKTLKVVPSLVDVRGKVAKMLVLQKRHYEALSLLASFDEELAGKGHGAYFEAQRLAIESAIERNGAAVVAERSGLRLAAQRNHFFVPVTLGVARPVTFLVDTGATVVVMDEALLTDSKVAYKVREKKAVFSTADNRKLTGQLLTLSALRLGPYDLKDVPVYACKGCAPLVGQSVLSRFDLKSSRLQGVEFLSLTLR